MKPSVGDVFKTNSGLCTVVEYLNALNVRVIFEDGYETYCETGNLRKGNVKNPYFPSVCGIGFYGVGNFSKNSHKKLYSIWTNLLQRCYDTLSLKDHPTYEGCFVSESWYNFQNFAHDYEQMVGSLLNWQLDKDILIKGNKLYSKERCCLVPQDVNKLFTKCGSSRGGLPIGVSINTRCKNSYRADCRINNENIYLGCFETELLAFQAYKEAKESEIKRVAELYKEYIDPKVYTALIDYKVEIDD